ncbi:DNA adenine methylase [Synechococcus phage S-BM3]|nr:DNA adenine methylase [Synechococcus phage S-BM3]
MTLSNQDCLEYIKSIPDNSVDLVLTDPPYFIGFDGGKGWDSQWGSEIEYLEWCDKWTEECVRVLKPERMLVVFGTLKTETFLLYKLRISDRNSVLTPQNEIVWSYNWGGRGKNNFARKHEYAWCWSKGKQFLFNADDVRVERKVSKNLRTGKAYEKGTIPTCVWEKNNHTTSKEYVNWHPTQKPLMILERIIKAYTNPGDTVLDIFSGSGSTMIASAQSDRNFLGCELDKSYYDKSLERYRDLVGARLPV